MKLLAIDTASSACSAALLSNGRIVASRVETMERGHAEALMPMVADVLDSAAAACPGGFRDLDCLAVTVGPGAFTGVRIGLAAAGGMAAAAGLPLVGLTTLEVVAAAEPAGGRPLLVALNSKRRDVYVQLFDAAGVALTAPQAVLPEGIPPLLPGEPIALTGDGCASVADVLRDAGRDFRRLPGPGRPEAAVLARLAAVRTGDGAALPAPGTVPRPLYLRAPDVTLPKSG
jgi:tRNA threonylcarbamoyladenosine biosynthesis protein TsaB